MVQRYVTGSTGIVVAVPQAERAVVDVRARYDPAVGYGVPAHVTVLFPWLPVGSIGEADLDGLRVLAAATPAFDAELVTVGRFPTVAWLAPAPSEAFAALTRTAWTRWPQCPPYGGLFDEPVPHLTIADGQPDQVLDAVSAMVAPRLPIVFRADVLTVLAFDGVHWRQEARFPLASVPDSGG